MIPLQDSYQLGTQLLKFLFIYVSLTATTYMETYDRSMADYDRSNNYHLLKNCDIYDVSSNIPY